MVSKLEKGCTFGLVLENRVNNMEELMKDGFNRIDTSLTGMQEKNEQMFNHMSERPTKSMARQITMLTTACGVLVGALTSAIGLLIYGARLA